MSPFEFGSPNRGDSNLKVLGDLFQKPISPEIICENFLFCLFCAFEIFALVIFNFEENFLISISLIKKFIIFVWDFSFHKLFCQVCLFFFDFFNFSFIHGNSFFPLCSIERKNRIKSRIELLERCWCDIETFEKIFHRMKEFPFLDIGFVALL